MIFRSLGVCGLLLQMTAVAHADSTTLSIAAISNYTYASGGSAAYDTYCVREGENFHYWARMAPVPYTNAVRYYDNNAPDYIFHDPELTHSSSDFDYALDRPGTAIGYYCGHGGNNGDLDFSPSGTGYACTTNANCPSGSYCPGPPPPAGTQKACIAQRRKRFQTSSTLSIHANSVLYGKDYGFNPAPSWALGESSVTGPWAGVGTNGGTNVQVIVNSVGFRSAYIYDDTANLFAGVHALLGTMATAATINSGYQIAYSDTADWPDRGSYLGYYIKYYQSSTFADVWGLPIFTTNGFGRRVLTGGSVNQVTNAGAHFVIAKDATSASALIHMYESWAGSRNEVYDGTGLGYWYWHVNCNYNCNTYGL